MLHLWPLGPCCPKFEVVSAAYHGGGVNMMKTKADGSLSEAQESRVLVQDTRILAGLAMTGYTWLFHVWQIAHMAAFYRKRIRATRRQKHSGTQCRDDVDHVLLTTARPLQSCTRVKLRLREGVLIELFGVCVSLISSGWSSFRHIHTPASLIQAESMV